MENLETGGFWRGRPVLVTGATGLVGSWLVRRLLDGGAEVVCLVRDEVPDNEFVRAGWRDRVKAASGDVCDAAVVERVLAEYEVDTVFHLAAQAIVTVANRQPVGTFESNIRGTWTVLEACRRTAAVRQIVLASSDKAYGAQPRLPYTEEMPLQGRHPYDVSKSCADLLAQSYAATYRLPVAITRCGNFFGGGDLNWNRLVPGTIRSALRNERPVIRSDGEYTRDYFYVEDGARAYLALAEALSRRPDLAGEAFNFCGGKPVTVKEMVRLILRLLDSRLEPEIRNEASHEIRDQYLSGEKAKRELDWNPVFSLEEGLRRTIAWYREFIGKKTKAARE